MSLCKDIEKATHMNWNNDHTLFVQTTDRFTESDNLSKLHKKPPKNENIFENDAIENCNFIMSQCNINEREIDAYISMANGGVNYSNECIEEHWKSRQQEATENEQEEEENNQPCSSQNKDMDNGNMATETGSQSDHSNNEITMHNHNLEHVEEVLRKCRLNRNAAIHGLIKEHIIKLEDLNIPGESSVSFDCESIWNS